MKLFTKILFILLILIILIIPILFISLLIKLTSKGPVLIWSRRIGLLDYEFKMPKFRTMVVNTPQVATHLLENPEKYITPIGKILRKFSLDELPQIYSIIMGDMNFIGPRPALYNQFDLIKLRRNKLINSIKPGVTGWAQVNGRDENSIEDKVILEEYYLKNKNFYLDIKILLLTIYFAIKKHNVSH